MSTPHNLAATGSFPSEPREVPLSLADLRIFLAVARTGSFSRAADRVCRTQPAVSQAVRRLEKDVGQRLLARSFPPIQLSPAGRVLQELGHQLFALCDEAKTALDRLSESGVPTVAIGSSETALHAVLPLVGRFRRECSEAEVEIRHVTASEVVTQVASGMLDVGVVAEHPSGPSIVAVPLASDRLVALMNPNHRLAMRGGLRLQDVENDAAPLRVGSTVPSVEAVKRLLELTDGIALLPSSCAEFELARFSCSCGYGRCRASRVLTRSPA